CFLEKRGAWRARTSGGCACLRQAARPRCASATTQPRSRHKAAGRNRHAPNPVRQDLAGPSGGAAPRWPRCRLYRPARAALGALAPRLRATGEARPARTQAGPDLLHAGPHRRHQARPRRHHQPPGAAFLKAMREGSRRNDIRLFDIDDPEQGISHVVAPELGMVLPGATHAVPDSHASTVGGLGALAFGCGTSELAHILATQVMALRRPKSMLIRLEGKLAAHVTAKDVALRIIAELGVAGARGHVVEYAGAAVRAMTIESRMTLCNLNIEMGGR